MTRTLHRVAVTVFVTAEGADEADAEAHAVLAVRRTLSAPGDLPAIETPSGPLLPVRVEKVMETGMAMGNRYLWVRPTSEAYRGGVDSA
jgi:hypothetical protein